MPPIHQIVPDYQALLSLEVPQVAHVVLQFLATNREGATIHQPAYLWNIFGVESTPANGYVANDPKAGHHKAAITEHLLAGWQWLLRESLILPAPGPTQGGVFVSTRGHAAANREAFESYRRAALLPQSLLDPSISATTFSAFLRGEYDIAIFASFRALEDTVRRICQVENHWVGVDLMRLAFKVPSGPLTDARILKAEQEAMSNVFAGAMGLFKNPTSHRLNAFNSPEEAVSLILFANYLIGLAYERASANGLV